MVYVYNASHTLITGEEGLPLDPTINSPVLDLDLDSEIQLRFLVGVLRAGLDPWWATPERRKTAAKQEIRKALSQIYAEAAADGAKPPNVNEAYALVVKRVAPKHAPKSKVMAELKAFADRRLGRGTHFGSK